MKYICNPVMVEYPYQFNKNPHTGEISINREAADPSVVFYRGRYYMLSSMTLGIWVSEDMVHWERHPFPEEADLYGYAPDICILGDWIYLTCGSEQKNGIIYRTKDILNGPYTAVELPFPIADPQLFGAEDGRLYLYWGCSSRTPIYGVELNPDTLEPVGEQRELISSDCMMKGFERIGDDHSILPRTEAEIEEVLAGKGMKKGVIPQEMYLLMHDIVSNAPYIEGPWMNQYNGTYYLQYAFAGTQYRIYGDGVYQSKNPLGPFELALNNPFSYVPGGFFPGAGHGSTFQDAYGNWWHAATMRISVNHNFERRVGIWPAGFDGDGELFCNQRYGDWPVSCPENEQEARGWNPWRNPEWMLLSYGKQASASSSEKGHRPEFAIDENVQTWWKADRKREEAKESGLPWLRVDLGKPYDVFAIQINFADESEEIRCCLEQDDDNSGGWRHIEEGLQQSQRYIERRHMVIRWILEGSVDGKNYRVLKDKSRTDTGYGHDLVVLETGMELQYIRLTVCELPFGQSPCVSGLRVFGKGDGVLPRIPEADAVRTGDGDFRVRMRAEGAVGYNILWGHEPDKLYHSCMSYKEECHIGALVQDREYYVRVDAFNESGIREGEVRYLNRAEGEKA